MRQACLTELKRKAPQLSLLDVPKVDWVGARVLVSHGSKDATRSGGRLRYEGRVLSFSAHGMRALVKGQGGAENLALPKWVPAEQCEILEFAD